jgi:ankyrin repeat protein
MIKYLVNKNININKVDNDGNNGYLLHCETPVDIPTLKYLESLGLDIWKIDKNGETAFIKACINSYPTTLKYLETKGFNKNHSSLSYVLKYIYSNTDEKINYILDTKYKDYIKNN